jgi:integrase/recombinase XerD
MISVSEQKIWVKKNKENLAKFIDNCYAEGLGEMRVRKYKYSLLKVSQILGMDFCKANRSDMEKLVANINKSDYKDWTKHDYKVCIKRFWKWLKKCEPDEYPEEVKWIKTTAKDGKNYLPEELLTLEEIKKMIDVADSVEWALMKAGLWK